MRGRGISGLAGLTHVLGVPAVLSVLAVMTSPAAAQEGAPKGDVRLEPVVVTATRTTLSDEEPPASTTVLTQEDIQSSANIAVDDILRTIPGFSLFRRSSSMVTSPSLDPEAQGVTLRGIGPSGASRALVLIDGIPMIDPFDGQVSWGKISAEQIERIEIVRGSGASLWGNYAMAGVINIITKQPTENGATVKASYGTNNLTDDNVSVTGRDGKVLVALDANIFNTDGFTLVQPSQRGPIDEDASSRHELINGHVAYALSDTASVTMHGRYFLEDRDNGTPLRTSHTSSGLVDLTGHVRTADGSDWQATIFSNMQSFNIQNSDVNDARTEEHLSHIQQTPYTDVGGSLLWSRRMLNPLLVTAGLDLHWIDGQSRDTFYQADGINVEDQQRSDGKQFFTGLFLQGIYTPTKQWEIALSGRADLWTNYDGTVMSTTDGSQRFEAKTKATFNPRLSLLYRATDWLHLRAAAYRAFRAPTLAELYRQSEVEDLVLLPNPNLGPERLNGAEAGFDLPLLESLDLRATGFWADIEDPITSIDTKTDVNGEAIERTRVNLGRARTFGAELETLYEPIRDVLLRGSYLYTDARLVTAPPMDKDLEGNQLPQIPTHSFTVSARYSNPRFFTFLIEGRWIDDQFEDQENGDKFTSYFVLNASLSRQLPFWNGEVYVAGENMLDKQYIVDQGGGIKIVGTPQLGHGGVRFRF